MQVTNFIRRIFNISPAVQSDGNRRWFEIRNSANKIVDIDIMDEIGGWGVSARQLASQIKSLGDDTKINMHIFSAGGDVLEANEIYNALKAHKGGVDVEIGALCASAATIIACVGGKITMAKNGLYMIHNPWTIAAGESEDFKRIASIMDKMKTTMVDSYAERTKMKQDDLSTLMNQETWMTAQEAKEKGFVDELVDDDPRADGIQDRFDLGRFRNSAAAISRIPKKPGEQSTPQGSGDTSKSADDAKNQTNQTKPLDIAGAYARGEFKVFN